MYTAGCLLILLLISFAIWIHAKMSSRINFIWSFHLSTAIRSDALNACTVVLGARRIGSNLNMKERAVYLFGFHHMYINIFENRGNYGLVEGGHIGDNVRHGGNSWALVKEQHWEHRGSQWIVPTKRCPHLTQCLRKQTKLYNLAEVSYHFLLGPNSNSFIWWVLHVCGIDIEPMCWLYPFTGIDYFKRLWWFKTSSHL